MPFAYSSEFREMVLEQIRVGQPVAKLARDLETTESTWHRWRRAYAGMNAPDVRRLKELEAESARLKRLLAGTELDKAMRWVRNGVSPRCEAVGRLMIRNSQGGLMAHSRAQLGGASRSKDSYLVCDGQEPVERLVDAVELILAELVRRIVVR